MFEVVINKTSFTAINNFFTLKLHLKTKIPSHYLISLKFNDFLYKKKN